MQYVSLYGNQAIGGKGGSAGTSFGAGGGGGGAGLGSAVFNNGSLCMLTGVTLNNNTATGGSAGAGRCVGSFCPSPASAGQGVDNFRGGFDRTNNHSCDVWWDILFTPAGLQENRSAGSLAGSLNTASPYTGGSYTYTLVSGTGADHNAKFSILGTQLYTTVPLDYEEVSTYSVRVRTTDIYGRSYEEVISITILDANDPPSEIPLSADSIAENLPPGTLVANLTAVDQDGPPHSFALVDGVAGCDGSGNAAFTVSGSQLLSSRIFDYEEQSEYSICLRVTDSGSPVHSLDQSFTIQVVDTNDAPESIQLSGSSLTENQPVGALVGSFTTNDPDAGQTHTYSLVNPGSGCDGSGNSAFNIVGSELRLAQVPDFEAQSSYSICVRSTDNGSPAQSVDQAFTISILDVNEAPVSINLDNDSLEENQSSGTLIGSFSADDPDAGQSHTFSLVQPGGSCPGTDNAAFTLTGAGLYSAGVFDFETRSAYEICVRATDNGLPAASLDLPFTITVLDVNEPPGEIILSANNLDENLPAGSLVANLTAVDQDYPPHSFALVRGITGCNGADNDAFAVSGSQLLSSREFDYEDQASYAICLEATDSGSPPERIHAAFTISINNVNEPPQTATPVPFPDQSITAGDTYQFTLPAGSFIDPDGDTLSYTATLQGGLPLPDWLVFDPSTRTFRGVAMQARQLDILVTASDPLGETASSSRGGNTRRIF